ncbi:MAG TPA: D-aminoacylase [Mucilaginibacter sp.]|jgi:N-acyl-D-amino-acid deacylase
MRNFYILILTMITAFSCTKKTTFDKIIRNGLVYDGKGGNPFRADIAINADTIAEIGDLSAMTAREEIDVHGLAVAPGFINMLSQADVTLIEDGRSQSDIRQGVTLEVMGEGSSMGPLTPKMKTQMTNSESDIRFKVAWNTLGEYLNYIEKKGISCNVASFVGAGTIRANVIGEDDRQPTPAELEQMQLLVKQAMQEGAMGVSTSLMYPPDSFAKTKELVALCKIASQYGGIYISHMRSESNRVNGALAELITIAKQANIPAEIFHFKVAGKDNWPQMDSVINQVESARKQGLKITADMYTYVASATGLTASFPPSLQDGGFDKLWQRLHDPAIRAKMAKAMHINATDWDNAYYSAGSPDNVLLLSFKQDSLKKFTGKTLAEVAKIRRKSPEETAIDLIVQDSTRIGVAYFEMNEANIKKEIALPWVSFCSDEGSYTNQGVFLKSSAHPRAYGSFIRVLGKYSRDENVLTLQAAIKKLAYLPATNLKLKKRGALLKGYYADIVVFDPAKVTDHATFDKPHQYATGILYVFVNGMQVLKDGNHTGAKPGRFIKGPGYGK